MDIPWDILHEYDYINSIFDHLGILFGLDIPWDILYEYDYIKSI